MWKTFALNKVNQSFITKSDYVFNYLFIKNYPLYLAIFISNFITKQG